MIETQFRKCIIILLFYSSGKVTDSFLLADKRDVATQFKVYSYTSDDESVVVSAML